MSSFFAFLSRMKLISRWGLMRNTVSENICEHSAEVAMIANALAIIDRKFYGGTADPDRVGMLALYHETAEVITGDMPTPIKYYNRQINAAYKDIERAAEARIIASLPDELRDEFAQLVSPDKATPEYRLVKYADKLAAYIKCIEELRASNSEFKSAHDSIGEELRNSDCPAVQYFMNTFIDAYYLTLDELKL